MFTRDQNVTIVSENFLQKTLMNTNTNIYGVFKVWSGLSRLLYDIMEEDSEVACQNYTVFQKKLHPFYFFNNFVDSAPIRIIFCRNVGNEFYNLLTLTYLLLYLTTGNQLKCCWRSRRRHVYIIMWTWLSLIHIWRCRRRG